MRHVPGRIRPYRLAAATLAGVGLLATTWAAPAQPPFAFVLDSDAGIDMEHDYGTPEKGYPTEFGGSGGAWIDYDGDGDVDAFLVNGMEGVGIRPGQDSREGLARGPGEDGHRLFRNLGGGTFRRVPAAAGAGDRVWGNGAAVGDVDNDGWPDLFVTAIGPDRLYRNNGDGTFSPWPAGVEDEEWATSAVFTDLNGDGNLDLYVVRYVEFDPDTPTLGDGICRYRGVEVFCGPEGLVGATDLLYRNRGDGSFEPWSNSVIDPGATYGFAVVSTDCDVDGIPEVYVASDSTINLLYVVGRDGEPEDTALFAGAGYSADGREQAGMSAAAGDFDGDGAMDLFVTNFQNDSNSLYRNVGDCTFEEISERLGLGASSHPFMGWAGQMVDLDGDGDLDVFVADGHIYPQLDEVEPYRQRNLLYRNLLREEGRARFDEVGEAVGGAMEIRESSRGALVGDYDDDADVDILVTNINASPSLLRNDATMQAPALRLTLVGRTGPRSAYGARVRVRSGEWTQWREHRHSDGYVGTNDPRMLLFLPAGTADELEVRWPGGARTELSDEGPGWLIIDETRGVIARRP